MRWLRSFAICAMLFSLMVTAASAEKRVALVIGNGAYKNVPKLPNPSNDAADVAAALRRSGFDVILETDLDQIGMQDASIRFAREARTDPALVKGAPHETPVRRLDEVKAARELILSDRAEPG